MLLSISQDENGARESDARSTVTPERHHNDLDPDIPLIFGDGGALDGTDLAAEATAKDCRPCVIPRDRDVDPHGERLLRKRGRDGQREQNHDSTHAGMVPGWRRSSPAFSQASASCRPHWSVPTGGAKLKVMTPAQFLDLACEVAVSNKERIVNDTQLHPLLLQRGVSPVEIESLKTTLAARGEIERSRVDGGYFDIAEPVFLRYAIKDVPPPKIKQARELCAAWRRPGGGDVSAERLAAELGLPISKAQMLFAYCMADLSR
jgi:hypothetical protein